MSQQHDPLASIDGNIKAPSNPLHPLSDADPKPAPSFAQESRQHQTLHQRLVGQEKYVTIPYSTCLLPCPRPYFANADNNYLHRSGKQAGNYVSPSDDIMSPASAKLNAFKEKRFAK